MDHIIFELPSNLQLKSNVDINLVKKYSRKNYNFFCIKCNHEFISYPKYISSGNICPYCAKNSRKLCDDQKCARCFNKSFASHGKSKFWDYTLNKNTPRDVFMTTALKAYFVCEVCNHGFETKISAVSKKNNPTWCPYCGNQQLCKNDDCKSCFEKSFASHYRSKYWSPNNKINPRNVFKSSGKKYEFDCDCGHSNMIVLNYIINNDIFCSYCCKPTQKLCNEEKCVLCYNNSFASHHRSKYWSPNNKINPRNVFKASGKKYEFNCVCGHSFSAELHTITKPGKESWCPYCSGSKLCQNEDCVTCFNKSFKSSEKIGLWSDTNTIDPRTIFKTTRTLCNFNCDLCGSSFVSSPYKGASCDKCIHKTEKKFWIWITTIFGNSIYQYRPDWSISHITKQKLPFDFYIPSLKVIVEIDGPQHFDQVRNWRNVKEIQKKDLYKMKLAYDHNISMIRIPYEYIYEDKSFEKYKIILLELFGQSELFDKQQFIYILKNNEDTRYNHLKYYDFTVKEYPDISKERVKS